MVSLGKSLYIYNFLGAMKLTIHVTLQEVFRSKVYFGLVERIELGLLVSPSDTKEVRNLATIKIFYKTKLSPFTHF